MKNILIALAVLLLYACDTSKKKTANTDSGSTIEQRIAEYIKLNEEMSLEKLMDYIYPKVFTIVPSNELLKEMKKGFDNEEVSVQIDSMKIDKIHPVFELDNGSFAKVNYSLVMLMDFHNTNDSTNEDDASQKELIRKAMAEKYGDENVGIDEETGLLKIRAGSLMVAVKDELAKEWCFVNLNDEDPMITKIFSKEVLDKLATYK